jgi:cohesin complex subunit SCC1
LVFSHQVQCQSDISFGAQNAQGLAQRFDGLSARLFRGVARYLKALFDDESGLERKSVAIDHLVRGKTRKEASRMFFETLVRQFTPPSFAVRCGASPSSWALIRSLFHPQVLTTKDYISVDQPNPFDLVRIKPGSKLLMSEF